jgi:cytochrome b involved in lipid metabolism
VIRLLFKKRVHQPEYQQSEATGDTVYNTGIQIQYKINKMEDHHPDKLRKEKSTKFLVRYRNRVYDISGFLNYHPGGRNVLISFKNQILDRALAQHPHSKSAYYLLEDFAVQHQKRYNECEVSDS